ncbi:hypothetical protein BJ165DRAFT_1403144 [Panaeolus papilionaceus]|nr:hypothetical protein BJ165DRAFT_1403144 [Panaeolus papilionaceus]
MNKWIYLQLRVQMRVRAKSLDSSSLGCSKACSIPGRNRFRTPRFECYIYFGSVRVPTLHIGALRWCAGGPSDARIGVLSLIGPYCLMTVLNDLLHGTPDTRNVVRHNGVHNEGPSSGAQVANSFYFKSKRLAKREEDSVGTCRIPRVVDRIEEVKRLGFLSHGG